MEKGVIVLVQRVMQGTVLGAKHAQEWKKIYKIK